MPEVTDKTQNLKNVTSSVTKQLIRIENFSRIQIISGYGLFRNKESPASEVE